MVPEAADQYSGRDGGGEGVRQEALAERRCLIPATGFYEWSEKDGKRRPYHFTRPDGQPFVFAGLGMFAAVEGGAAVQVAILTTEASEFMKPFHHRMPVIMPPETWDAWLDCQGTSSAEAIKLLGPAPEDFFVAVLGVRGHRPPRFAQGPPTAAIPGFR